MPSYEGIVLAATVVIHGAALSSVDAPGPELPAEAATSVHRTRGSLGRRAGWGAAAGAAAGALTGLAVLAMCDSYCVGARGRGLALHVGVGAAVGGAVGALIHLGRE